MFALVRLASFLKICKEDHILDIGLGTGKALASLSILTGASGYGIDINETFVSLARWLFAMVISTARSEHLPCGTLGADVADFLEDATQLALQGHLSRSRIVVWMVPSKSLK